MDKFFHLFCSFAVAIVMTCISGMIYAQKLPMKYGKVEPEYFALKSYDKDTTAEALVLGDFGETRVVYDPKEGFIVECSRHFRAKIFKKSGYDWATHSLILYHNSYGQDKLSVLKGTVYNMEEGKVVESELDRKSVFEEIIDNKRVEKKFTLPNVREGSIIEYTYTIRSDFWSIPDWHFQYTIPALWSEYRVSYAEYFEFKKLQKGYLSFDVFEETTKPVNITVLETERTGVYIAQSSSSTYQIKFMDKCFRWIKNDVPAFREEPYMNALINYLTAMEFELAAYNPPAGLSHNYTQTWEKINEELLADEDFGLQLKRGGFLKDVVSQIKSMHSDPVNQMIASFEYVRNSMKWDERNRIYATQGLRSAFDRKSGSAADINLMLVTLLKEMGLQADAVILSTRSNGMIHPAQIMVNQFNYVIAYAKIGENTYLMDATEKVCPHNMLPTRCINGQGRIISENQAGWIDLNSSQRYEYTNIVNTAIKTDGTITGKMQRTFGNYAAMEKRTEVKNSKDNDEYIRSVENNNKGLTVTNYELINLDSLRKSYTENLDVVISNASLVAGNLISFSPMLFDQWITNPFKLEDRKFPVDFTYPRVYKDVITYEIPDGFVLDEKPTDLVIAFPDGKTKFTYRFASNGKVLQVMSTLSIGKSLYNYDEYVLLKEFYSNLVKKQAEKVVLKKTS